MSEVQQDVQVRQVASGEVENLRRELSQSHVEGSHVQNLKTTSRSGSSENSSENQQLRLEREQLMVDSHNLETGKRGSFS